MLEHRLVAGYLRDLDAALAGLPAAAAAELAEQLRAHLPEALPPDADEDAVMAVLAALGPARTWLAVAAVTTGVGFPAGTLTLWQVQPSVQFRGGSAWWNPVDGARVVQTEADGATQYTVPLRPGKIQGFAIFIYNPSPITQVITGSADIISPGAPVPPQIGVATTGTVRTGDPHAVSYRAGGPIPPHSYRWVRVLWRSALCYLEAAGGSEHIPLGGEMPVEGALGQAGRSAITATVVSSYPLLGEQLKRSHDGSLARPVPSAACMVDSVVVVAEKMRSPRPGCSGGGRRHPP